MINPDIPEKPSLCLHDETRLSDTETICLKCGRIRRTIKERGIEIFLYCNGVKYLTKQKEDNL